jgi:hypothetical protein
VLPWDEEGDDTMCTQESETGRQNRGFVHMR